MTVPVPENDLTTLLADLVSVNHRLTRTAARAAGGNISPALWRTLSALTATGPIRLGELAEFSRISQPTTTKLVDGLVERGWVERRADEHDSRATRIVITPAGSDELAAWRSQLATAMLPLFADLTVSETDTIRHAVEIIRERIDRQETGSAASGAAHE